MKKIFLFIIFAMWLSARTASAYDFESDGLYYNISGYHTVEVTNGIKDYSGYVTIPSSVIYQGETYEVTGIGSSAFIFCAFLTGVDIPYSVTEIGSSAFNSCSSLSSVDIPGPVTEIGVFAFSFCSSLSNLTISYSPNLMIGDYAFQGCTALSKVICLAETPPDIMSHTFDQSHYSDVHVVVPVGCVDDYRSAENWSNFATITVYVPEMRNYEGNRW